MMKEWEGKPKETRKAKEMITKEEIRNITNEWAEDSDDYAQICLNRPEWKHQYFVLDDHLYFEYWDEHEYEFTVYGDVSNKMYDLYMMVAVELNFHANIIKLNERKLSEYVKYCKARIASVSKKVS